MFLTVCSPRKSAPNRQLALDLVVDAAGDVDAAGLGQRLQAGGDVDAIAEQVIALDHHVAEVDADPKLEPSVLGQLAISGCQLLLNLDRTSRRFDGARKFGQDAVPGAPDDPAVAAGYQRIHLLPIGVQGAERAFLVSRHEAAVALHVGAEDGRELTLDARRGRSSAALRTPRGVVHQRAVSVRRSGLASQLTARGQASCTPINGSSGTGS